MQECILTHTSGLLMVELFHLILTTKSQQRNGHMKTNQQLETEAILSMVENMKALEQQLADAKKRITDMELIIANQRAAIKELQ
jgi:hypothetical protein